MSDSRPTISLGWRPALTTLFVVALQMSLGNRADASCGDWLAHDSMPSPEQQLADADESRDVPSPCSSGQCRRAPDHPLPGSPHRSVIPQPDQWGALAGWVLPLRSATDPLALEVPLHFPEGLRVLLERPPQS